MVGSWNSVQGNEVALYHGKISSGACSIVPSIQGENNSQQSRGNNEEGTGDGTFKVTFKCEPMLIGAILEVSCM